jgi:hypothetical protein
MCAEFHRSPTEDGKEGDRLAQEALASVAEASRHPGLKGSAPALLGWSTNFATGLQVRLEHGQPREIFTAVMDWAVRRFDRRHTPRIDVASFMSEIEICSGGVELTTKSLSRDVGREAPDHWLMTLSHPQTDFSARTWRTRIGISRHAQLLNGSITNEHQIAPSYVGTPEHPAFSIPRIVHELVDQKRGDKQMWTTWSGKMQVGAKPASVNHYELCDFIQQLRDPKRSLPLVAFSPIDSGGPYPVRYPLDLQFVTGRLIGIAGVQLLASNDLFESLGWIGKPVSKGDLPHRGWVYVYPPARPDAELKPIRISLEAIEEDRTAFLANLQVLALRHVLAQRAVEDSSHAVVRSDNDSLRIQRAWQLADLREAVSKSRVTTNERNSDTDRASMEQQLNDAMEYQNLQDQLIEELEERVNELELERCRLVEEVSTLTTELDGQRNLINVYQNELAKRKTVRTDVPLKQPETIVEALEWLVKSFGSKIVILPEAHQTAQDMLDRKNLSKPAAKKKALSPLTVALPRLYECKFGDNAGGVDPQSLRADIGFDISFAKSSQVDSDRDLRKHPMVSYGGLDKYVPAHVKFGNIPGQQMRVHFFFDEDKRLLVIAKVVDHLPIGSSRMDGKSA